MFLSRRALLASMLVPATSARAQKPFRPNSAAKSAFTPIEYVCPMDPDVKSPIPGVCPRCHMQLVSGLPDFAEYRVDVEHSPPSLKPGTLAVLRISIHDPVSNHLVREFAVVHEKLMHVFLVGEDLDSFAHEHPALQPDGIFTLQYRFPKGGMYRLLLDYFPEAGTPQLTPATIYVDGCVLAKNLIPDLEQKRGENLSVSLVGFQDGAFAGQKTFLQFDVSPITGLEQFVGAWGHMLVASADLIDMIHLHPSILICDGVTQPSLAPDAIPSTIQRVVLQFNVIFPRAGIHRLWLQVQRAGVVNTIAFTVPVRSL